MSDTTDMTPEERFTRIENFLWTTAEHLDRLAEHQTRHSERIDRHDEEIEEIRATLHLASAVTVKVAKLQHSTEEKLNALDEKLQILADLVNRNLRGPDDQPA